MPKYDLSILIPARNEEFISNTVADILKNKRGRTEVIVGLDGAWAEPGIPDHPDVRIVYMAESIGQRAMTNRLARLSQAKYVAKTDAHCAFGEGFDVKLMEAMKGHDDWTIVPVMRNLHAFSWKCDDCGHETYQGPMPEGCANTSCPAKKYSFHKDVKWFAKPSPQSTAYRFNTNLQFKYFGELKRTQEQSGSHLVDTMSLQGSFFMLTRKKYWELNICDETWGSWGQQGTEVALKTWLSGGRVVCNKSTWYAHMFRTQNGFSFPYPMSGRDQEKARRISQDIFKNGKWSKQVRPLSWVLERFWDDLKRVSDPEARWTEAEFKAQKQREERMEGPSKGIIFYSDCALDETLANKVVDNLKQISKKKSIPIASATLKPMDMGKNVHVIGERSVLTMFRQIVAALEASDAEIVYLCESDVLYHPSHFDFTPPKKDKFYYNLNVWRMRYGDGKTVTWDANQVAELCGYREHVLAWYKNKLEQVLTDKFNRSYEPGGRDTSQYENWRSEVGNIDVREHGTNLTRSKWSLKDFRDKSTGANFREVGYDEIPGWQPGQFDGIVQ
jgi:hypothetical protein